MVLVDQIKCSLQLLGPALPSSAVVFSAPTSAQPMDHNPLGFLNSPLMGVTFQISCIADIYITTPNSSKITIIEEQELILCLEGHHSMRNCINRSHHKEG